MRNDRQFGREGLWMCMGEPSGWQKRMQRASRLVTIFRDELRSRSGVHLQFHETMEFPPHTVHEAVHGWKVAMILRPGEIRTTHRDHLAAAPYKRIGRRGPTRRPHPHTPGSIFNVESRRYVHVRGNKRRPGRGENTSNFPLRSDLFYKSCFARVLFHGLRNSPSCG